MDNICLFADLFGLDVSKVRTQIELSVNISCIYCGNVLIPSELSQTKTSLNIFVMSYVAKYWVLQNTGILHAKPRYTMVLTGSTTLTMYDQDTA